MRAHVPAGRGAVGRDGRRREPRVHGRRRGRRGRLRVVQGVRLRRQRRGRAPAGAERPGAAPRPTRRRAEKVHTPDLPGIAGVSKFLGVEPERDVEVHRVRRRRRARARDRARRPRGQRVRARGRARAEARAPVRRRRLRRAPRAPEGLHRPALRRARRVVVADPAIAAPIGWVTGANEHRPPRAQRGARPRLPRRRVGRPRDDRARRPVPALRAAAVGRPRHRGRARVPARHEVLASRSTRTTPTRTASSTRW